jgi:hypothetical protein
MTKSHALDCFQSDMIVGTTAYRRGAKAIQLLMPKSILPTVGEPLSRKQAVMKVKRWLSKPTITPVIERKVKSLMYLFLIEAEELLEVGVSYESVCALQRHWLI